MFWAAWVLEVSIWPRPMKEKDARLQDKRRKRSFLRLQRAMPGQARRENEGYRKFITA
jgi:hypothetical protein